MRGETARVQRGVRDACAGAAEVTDDDDHVVSVTPAVVIRDRSLRRPSMSGAGANQVNLSV
jgi:hypothetical protein